MRLSLKAQTRLTFAVLLLCFIGLGAIGVDRLAAVSNQSTIMTKVWTPKSLAAEQLAGAARDYRISEALRILSVTPDMAQHADQDLKDNADLFAAKMAEYRHLLRPHENAGALDNVEALWTRYLSGNEQMIQYAKDGKTVEASDRFRNSASKFYLVANALSDVYDDDTKQSALASASAQKINDQAKLLVFGALGLMSVLLLFAAIFFESRVWRALVRLSTTMQKLAQGDFTADVAGNARRDEVGDMARAVQVFKDNGLEMRRLEQEAETQRLAADAARQRHDEMVAAVDAQRNFVVSSIATGLAELSGGDLTFRLSEEFAPEFEKLRADFNTAVANLQDTMKVIAFGAVGIHSSTEEISQASDNLARRTEKQAASLEELAAALEQVTTTVRTSAEGAKSAKLAVASAKSNAERSAEVVRSAVSAMSEIERSARQISEIIGVMDEIAFQTNLLALNAGVEAARAGEAGRGFAVVAQEVRALAQRSTVAAKEIKALISSSSQQVGAGVNLVGETGKALEMIATQVGEINGAVGDIALAAEEQASGLVQINMSVSQMDKVTQQNAAMAEESTAASHNLAQETNELARLIGRFQLGDVAAPVAEPRPRQAPPRGRAILQTLSSGNAALAVKLEDAIAEESWEEF
jgi:methyl-accepting chemotaxis protein